MQTSDVIATASFISSLLAVGVSIYAIVKSNRNSSVATLVSLNQGWRQAWDAFLAAKTDDDRYFSLAELMNLLEIACGIQNEGSFYGVSKDLLSQYLAETLSLLIKNGYTNQQIGTMLSAPTTFSNIRQVLKMQARSLSVTVPPTWNEQL